MEHLITTWVRRAASGNRTSLIFVVAVLTAALPKSAWADPVLVQSGSFGRSGGDPIDFSSSFSGPAFATGPVRFGGTVVSPPPGFSTGVFLADVRVDGPTGAAPPIGSDGVGCLTEPFTFSGSLDARAAKGSPMAYELGPTSFAADSVGSGDARLVLAPTPCPTFDCVPAPPYHVGLLSYGFSPTPEPGTLCLLALGGGRLATRRTLRQQARS
jgi:hypothetical protein